MWMRATSVCRQVGGWWRVVHDHVSVPFDPTTSKIVLGMEP
jgi:ketosteroid isomerase-like protein